MRTAWFNSLAIFLVILLVGGSMRGVARKPAPRQQKVILDTDIGGDIDDAFALALILTSPELKLIGVTAASGDTQLRARLAARMLCETGKSSIPVFAGVPTDQRAFTQTAWASQFPESRISQEDAITWMARTIRQNPGQITLIAIGPMSNLGALIDRDPASFHMLKRVVLMGGSIRRAYHDLGIVPSQPPSPEYNIRSDVPAAQKLFSSGVPIYMLPLDSTLLLRMDDARQQTVFQRNTPLTDALAQLTSQWAAKRTSRIPTLFDVMAVEAAINPKLCPFEPMDIHVDDAGYTRVEAGKPDAFVCLNSDPSTFFNFLIPRLTQQSLRSAPSESCFANRPGQ